MNISAIESRYLPISVSAFKKRAINPSIPSKIIPIKIHIIPNLNSSSKIYITFDPNDENLGEFATAGVEISRLTGGLYNIPTIGAYTQDSDPINPNIPLKTCDEDATDSVTIITIDKVSGGDQDGAFLQKDCIFIKAENTEDLRLIADRIGMNLIGITI